MIWNEPETSAFIIPFMVSSSCCLKPLSKNISSLNLNLKVSQVQGLYVELIVAWFVWVQIEREGFFHLLYAGMPNSKESCGRSQISHKSLRTEVKSTTSVSFHIITLLMINAFPCSCALLQALAPCWHGSSWRTAPVNPPLWRCSSPARAAHCPAATSSCSAPDTDSPSSKRGLLQVRPKPDRHAKYMIIKPMFEIVFLILKNECL